MGIKAAEDILRINGKFAKSMEKRIEALRAGRSLKIEEIVHEKEKHLKRWKQRYKSLGQAKKEAISRFDEEIGRCEESILRLEKEIEKDRKTIERVTAETVKKRKGKKKVERRPKK